MSGPPGASNSRDGRAVGGLVADVGAQVGLSSAEQKWAAQFLIAAGAGSASAMCGKWQHSHPQHTFSLQDDQTAMRYPQQVLHGQEQHSQARSGLPSGMSPAPVHVVTQWKNSAAFAETTSMLSKLLELVEPKSRSSTMSSQGSAGRCQESLRQAGVEPAPTTTTLMVHNIPVDSTLETLFQYWPADGGYDFLYVPMSSGGKRAIGYAFVNFVSEELATSFRERWHGERFEGVAGARKLRVVAADVQGRDANVQQLSRSLVTG